MTYRSLAVGLFVGAVVSGCRADRAFVQVPSASGAPSAPAVTREDLRPPEWLDPGTSYVYRLRRSARVDGTLTIDVDERGIVRFVSKEQEGTTAVEGWRGGRVQLETQLPRPPLDLGARAGREDRRLIDERVTGSSATSLSAFRHPLLERLSFEREESFLRFDVELVLNEQTMAVARRAHAVFDTRSNVIDQVEWSSTDGQTFAYFFDAASTRARRDQRAELARVARAGATSYDAWLEARPPRERLRELVSERMLHEGGPGPRTLGINNETDRALWKFHLRAHPADVYRVVAASLPMDDATLAEIVAEVPCSKLPSEAFEAIRRDFTRTIGLLQSCEDPRARRFWRSPRPAWATASQLFTSDAVRWLTPRAATEIAEQRSRWEVDATSIPETKLAPFARALLALSRGPATSESTLAATDWLKSLTLTDDDSTQRTEDAIRKIEQVSYSAWLRTSIDDGSLPFGKAFIALRRLAAFPSPATRSFLRTKLASGDPALADAAAFALAAHHDPTAIPYLLGSLELPIHALQAERALEALALFHDDTFGYDPAGGELLNIAACARWRVWAGRARFPTLDH